MDTLALKLRFSVMKRLYFISNILIVIAILQACSKITIKETDHAFERAIAIEQKTNRQTDAINLDFYTNLEPQEWGEHVTGVNTRLKTNEKKIALTFDACGGDYGSGYDQELISFLINEKIPATLFINERWIYENEDTFLELSSYPLFQIENHGTNHSPLSVNGGKAWGIQATESPFEVYQEIMKNHQTVKDLIGREMTLFRSGTAYYDEVSVQIANELGYDVVNFDILGDAGATYSSEQVKNALLNAKNGSIVLLHMNQPHSGTAEGVKNAIPLLRKKGFEFVLLENEILE